MMLDQPGPVLQPAESETPAAATDVLTVVWAALLDAAYTRSQKSGRQGQGVPRLRGQRARARALGSNLAGNLVSQHRLCVIDVITSIHTVCRLHETRQEGRVPTERPLKAQARVPPRRALRGSQR